MSEQVPQGTCLQCGETRERVKAEGYYCVIGGMTQDGWEANEDWEHHRWADWHPTELNRYGILPEFHDLYRRTDISELRQFIDCTHRGRQHEYEQWGPTSWVCLCCYGSTEHRPPLGATAPTTTTTQEEA